MADAFIGEIRAFAFGYVPDGWLACDGSEYATAQHQALAVILGNRYGGNPPNTFRVPDLRGQTALGAGQGPGLTNRLLAAAVGTEGVAISYNQSPVHNHTLKAKGQTGATTAMKAAPAATYYLSRLNNNATTSGTAYAKPPITDVGTLASGTIGFAGGTGGGPAAAHENRQPYLPLVFCINYDGEWPPNPN